MTEEKIAIKEGKNCDSAGKYIALIIIFAIISATGWFMYYQESKINKQTIVKYETVTDEKAKVTTELNELLVQYDDLSTNNDSLNLQLSAEKQKIALLIDEIKKTKNASGWQIAKYKKELGTLRQIMRGYIHQIDSLNTLNIALKTENTTVKTQYNDVQNEKKVLEDKNSELSTKVSIATTLRAMNINAIGINEKGKEKNKANKVEKIKVCFTVAQNKVTEAGNKDIYIRITAPNNVVLGNATTILDGTETTYSAYRSIEYENKDIDVCVFWANNTKLEAGNYVVDIFESGKIIGNSTFFLK
jgi:peptidoglycan hydrolase CwlO-like protein